MSNVPRTTLDLEMDVYESYEDPLVIDHNTTTKRDEANCHPIGAITGLQDELDSKMDDSQIDTEVISTSSEKVPSSKLVKTAIDSLEDFKVDKIPGKGLSTNDFSNALRDKLDGIESGAEVNVNADWTAESGDAQILNKPALATVATSGAYADLSGLPTLGTASALDTGTAAGNIPVLDANGKLANNVIPPLAIGDSVEFPEGTPATKANLVTLSDAEKGDIAEVTEETDASGLNGVYWLNGSYNVLSDWIQIVGPAQVISVNGQSGIVTLGKSDIGLGNVDNTADADKPVSTAVQTALDAKANDNAVVHLNGAETISGEKTFYNSAFSNVKVKTGRTTGNIGGLSFVDKNGDTVSSINASLDGQIYLNFYGTTKALQLTSNRAYNSSNTADVVTIASLQASTDVVHTSGNETIIGRKIFAGDFELQTSAIDTNNPVNVNWNPVLFKDKNGNVIGGIRGGQTAGGKLSNGFQIRRSGTITGELNIQDDGTNVFVTAPYRTSNITNDDVLTAGNGVTLGTAQTITGTKTLHNTNYSGLFIKSARTTSSMNIGGLGFQDGNDNFHAYIAGTVGGDLELNVTSDSNSGARVEGQRAYNSANVKDIVTIASLQASTDVVHTAGNETIAGVKTFERIITTYPIDTKRADASGFTNGAKTVRIYTADATQFSNHRAWVRVVSGGTIMQMFIALNSTSSIGITVIGGVPSGWKIIGTIDSSNKFALWVTVPYITSRVWYDVIRETNVNYATVSLLTVDATVSAEPASQDYAVYEVGQ